MKLLLTSDGFSTPEIVDALVALCAKPRETITFGLINEAYAVERGDKRWLITDFDRIAANFPGSIDMINLLALDHGGVQDRLSAVDVILVTGGHTDYLMHVFDKTGFSTLLPTLLRDKAYVGLSAGSMVVGHRISTEAYRTVYREEGTYGVTRYLELVDLAVKPHLDSDLFPQNREPVLRGVCSGMQVPVYALRDDAALIVRDGEITPVGSPPLAIQPNG